MNSNFSEDFMDKWLGIIDEKWKKFNKIFEHILIQTNNLCTRKCPFCYFWIQKQKAIPEQIASPAVFEIINQLSEINYDGRIWFFDINEPLTDPRIYEFIEYASLKVKKAWIMIITNGDLLTPESFLKLSMAWIDQVMVSVYTDSTMNNVSKLKNLETKFIFDIMDFRKWTFEDNRWWNIEYLDFSTNKIKYNGEYLKNACERVNKIMVIKSSWDVVSCFSDFFKTNIVGNIYKEKLIDIRFWEKFSTLRDNLNNGKRNLYEICRKCNYPGKWWFFKTHKQHNEKSKKN